MLLHSQDYQIKMKALIKEEVLLRSIDILSFFHRLCSCSSTSNGSMYSQSQW